VKKDNRFVGLDVHAETIAVAVAEADGEARSLGVIPNRSEAVRRLVKKLGPAESLQVCYEAGPCGYVLGPECAKGASHFASTRPILDVESALDAEPRLPRRGWPAAGPGPTAKGIQRWSTEVLADHASVTV
jgi:hypothetical protein